VAWSQLAAQQGGNGQLEFVRIIHGDHGIDGPESPPERNVGGVDPQREPFDPGRQCRPCRSRCALWYRRNRDRCDRPATTCRSGSSSA